MCTTTAAASHFPADGSGGKHSPHLSHPLTLSWPRPTAAAGCLNASGGANSSSQNPQLSDIRTRTLKAAAAHHLIGARGRGSRSASVAAASRFFAGGGGRSQSNSPHGHTTLTRTLRAAADGRLTGGVG